MDPLFLAAVGVMFGIPTTACAILIGGYVTRRIDASHRNDGNKYYRHRRRLRRKSNRYPDDTLATIDFHECDCAKCNPPTTTLPESTYAYAPPQTPVSNTIPTIEIDNASSLAPSHPSERAPSIKIKVDIAMPGAQASNSPPSIIDYALPNPQALPAGRPASVCSYRPGQQCSDEWAMAKPRAAGRPASIHSVIPGSV